MELDNQLLLNVWRKGKPLNEAIWKFCDKNYIEQYNQIGIKEPNYNEKTALESLAIGLQQLSSYSTQSTIAKEKLYKDLYEKIINGGLIAIGFKSPIKSEFPILIPLHMWSPETIDINKSAISANNIGFVRVRIIKESAFEQIKNKQVLKKEFSLPEIKDQKTGRPSLKKEIIAAYVYLKETNQIDYLKPLKAHTELIQQTVQKLNPEIKDTRGMKHEAIRRIISHLFKADKENL